MLWPVVLFVQTNALEPSEGEPQIGDSSETAKNPVSK